MHLSVFCYSLSVIARFMFGIPASSAASERNFSIAGTAVTERRARLSPESVDSIGVKCEL